MSESIDITLENFEDHDGGGEVPPPPAVEAFEKLDPEFKKQWIEALRSGTYYQGRTRLCRIGPEGQRQFCCLGVALELLAPGGWKGTKRDTSGEFRNFEYRDDAKLLRYDVDCRLPEPLSEKVHLDLRAEDRLISLNDDRSFSFFQIASWIEVHL